MRRVRERVEISSSPNMSILPTISPSSEGGGMTHVTEGVRQLMGRGEGRQVDPVPEYCFVNG